MKTELVVVGYLIYNNKVLLIHHKKSGKWLPPGGHIEKGETPDETLIREIKEETGLEIEILNRNDVPKEGNIIEQLAVPFYVNVHNVGDHNHCCFFYLCIPKNPEDILIKKSEVDDFKWLTTEELKQDYVPNEIRNTAMKAFDKFKELNEHSRQS
jgi:8-oxo-dGTP pyrophosphatase MutT (NUDIX family)